MTKRYKIWNKQDDILTNSGKCYTAEQWIAKRPLCGYDSVTVVLSAGVINGAICEYLSEMKMKAESMGCDFSACTTDEEILQAIEDFEDYLRAQAAETASQPTAEQRTATALEAIAEGATSETKEQVAIMAEDLEALDETAISLYEEVENQTATNEAQDEALIELYELTAQ